MSNDSENLLDQKALEGFRHVRSYTIEVEVQHDGSWKRISELPSYEDSVMESVIRSPGGND
jgi:hypothetical protein